MRPHQVGIEGAELRTKLHSRHRHLDVRLVVRLHLTTMLFRDLLQLGDCLLLHQVLMHQLRPHRVIKTLQDLQVVIDAGLTLVTTIGDELTVLSEIAIDIHCLGKVGHHFLTI